MAKTKGKRQMSEGRKATNPGTNFSKKEEETEQTNETYGEKYFEVVFHARSSPNDTESVQLAVNGETLIMQREMPVIVPQRFLECADHAVRPVFRQLPNKPRKVTGSVKTYPYEKKRPATREEYENQKREGTQKTLDDIRKFGFNPEDESE